MTIREQNELIEKYLTGRMSPVERDLFEERMAEDDYLRKAVEHQRAKIEEETLPRPRRQKPAKLSNPTLVTTLLIVLMLSVVAWWVFTNGNQPEIASVPEVQEMEYTSEIEEQDNPGEGTATLAVNHEPGNDANPKNTMQERDTVDPEAFKPNTALESRIGMFPRGHIIEVDFFQPFLEENFQSKDGVVNINFSGEIVMRWRPLAPVFHINIYTNEYDDFRSNQPVYTLMLQPTAIGGISSEYVYNTYENLELAPGLYYYTLTDYQGRDPLQVGKFYVDRQLLQS